MIKQIIILINKEIIIIGQFNKMVCLLNQYMCNIIQLIKRRTDC